MSKLNTNQAYSIQKILLEMAVRQVETGGLELREGYEGDAPRASITQVMYCHLHCNMLHYWGTAIRALTMLHSFHARSMTRLCSNLTHWIIYKILLNEAAEGRQTKNPKQSDALVSDFLFKKTIPKRVHRIRGDAILTKFQSKRKNLNWTVGAIIADLLKCLDRKAHVCTH